MLIILGVYGMALMLVSNINSNSACLYAYQQEEIIIVQTWIEIILKKMCGPTQSEKDQHIYKFTIHRLSN